MADSPRFLSPFPISKARKKAMNRKESVKRTTRPHLLQEQVVAKTNPKFKDVIMPAQGKNPHFKNQIKKAQPQKKIIKKVKIAPAIQIKRPQIGLKKQRGPKKPQYFNQLPHVVDFPMFKSCYHSLEGKNVPIKQLERINFPQVFKEIKRLAVNKGTSARQNQLLMKYALKLMKTKHRKNANNFQELYERVYMGELKEEEMITVIKKEERQQQFSQIESVEVLLDQADLNEPWKSEEDSQIARWRKEGMKQDQLSQFSFSDSLWEGMPGFVLKNDNDAQYLNLEENEVYQMQENQFQVEPYAPPVQIDEVAWDYVDHEQNAKDSQQSEGVGSSQGGVPSDKRSGSQSSSQSQKSLDDSKKALEELEYAISRYAPDVPDLLQNKVGQNKNAIAANQKIGRRAKRGKMKKNTIMEYLQNLGNQIEKEQLRSEGIRFQDIELHPSSLGRREILDLERAKKRFIMSTQNPWMNTQGKFGNAPKFQISGDQGGGYYPQDFEGDDGRKATGELIQRGDDNMNVYEKLQEDLPFKEGDKVPECGYKEKIKVTQKAAEERALLILQISAQLIDERGSVPVTLKQALYSLNVRSATLQMEAFFNLQRNGHCLLYQEDDGPEAPIYIIPSVSVRKKMLELGPL